MREIILLRHAETMPSSAAIDDASRPLSPHGKEAARQAGAWLAAQGAAPDMALVSSANRASMTAELALAALPATTSHSESRIYDATPGDLMQLLDECPAQQILLVGHNPGLEQLVALLVSGQSGDFRGMPPAAIAWLRVEDALEPGSATLDAFWSP